MHSNYRKISLSSTFIITKLRNVIIISLSLQFCLCLIIYVYCMGQWTSAPSSYNHCTLHRGTIQACYCWHDTLTTSLFSINTDFTKLVHTKLKNTRYAYWKSLKKQYPPSLPMLNVFHAPVRKRVE